MAERRISRKRMVAALNVAPDHDCNENWIPARAHAGMVITVKCSRCEAGRILDKTERYPAQP